MHAAKLRLRIPQDMPVGQVAAQIPAATEVFERHGIDYTCGGKHPLGEVLSSSAIDYGQFLEELETAEREHEELHCWLDESVAHVIAYLAGTHLWFREQLPRIQALAEEVADESRDAGTEPAVGIGRLLRHFAADLEWHIAKEETSIFPAILALDRDVEGKRRFAVGHRVSVLEREHDAAGRILHEIRELTGDFTKPDDAAHGSLYDALRALESRVRLHVHLENNILFPRTRQVESIGVRNS